jgi:hypothetical protein
MGHPLLERTWDTVMSAAYINLDELTTKSSWPVEALETINGHSRGVLLTDWVEVFSRRLGRTAVSRIREGLGKLSAAIPDAPGHKDWIPLGAQIRFIDVVLRDILDGDIDALEAVLTEAVKRRHRSALLLARAIGPRGAFGQAGRIHRLCFDTGEVEVTTTRTSATITTTNPELSSQPTWQLLQLFAARLLVKFSGRKPTRTVGQHDQDRFIAEVHWR